MPLSSRGPPEPAKSARLAYPQLGQVITALESSCGGIRLRPAGQVDHPDPVEGAPRFFTSGHDDLASARFEPFGPASGSGFLAVGTKVRPMPSERNSLTEC